MGANERRGNINLQVTVSAKDAIDSQIQVKLNDMARALNGIVKAQEAVARGSDIAKLWKSELSTLDGVTEAYRRYENAVKHGATEVRVTNFATDLVKGYSAFLAKGGEMSDLVERIGTNMQSTIDKAMELVSPKIAREYNVDALKEMYSSIEYMSKSFGTDFSNIFDRLAAADTEGLTNSLRRSRQEVAALEGELASLQVRYDRLEAGEGVADIKAQLDDVQMKYATIVSSMQDEFKAFLVSNNFSGDDLTRFGRFGYYFDAIGEIIEEGGIDVGNTVRRVIGQFKQDFEYLLHEMNSVPADGASGVVETVGEVARQTEAIGAAVDSSSQSGDKIRDFAGAVTELVTGLADAGAQAKGASGSADAITKIVGAVAHLADVDVGNVHAIFNVFAALRQLSGLKVSGTTLSNISQTLRELSEVKSPEVLSMVSRVSFGNLEKLKVSKSSLVNLATYLPKIAEIDTGRIKALTEIDFSNLNNLKVSKASITNIKSLFGIADEITNIRRQMEDAVGVPIATTGTVDGAATQIQQQVAQAATEVAAAEQAEADAAQATAVAEQAVADVAADTAGAKRNKAAAAQEVSQAEHAEAAAAEQAASAEANAAEAAEVASGAKQAEAQAAKDAATAERDLADAQKQAASQDIGDKEKEESVAMRAAYLKELIDLQKQLEVLQINQPDTYLANQQGFDTLISSLGSAIDEGRADLEGWLNELERTGTVSQETIATVRTLAAEIKKVAAIDAAQQKAQNAIADAELRLQQQHARQAVSSTGGKYYDVEGVQALKDAYTTLADDITKAKAASKSMSDETRNGFISRAEDIVEQSEALREQARYAEELAQEQREYQSTVNSAYRESAEIQREEAEAAKAREAAFQRLEAAARKEAEAEEQAAIREGRAMLKAADDAEAAALKREQSTQAAELKSIQQQAQQALSAATKNNVDTSAVEYMRNEVNALSADIQKVTADMSTYSEEVRSGFETRLQLIEQSSHAIQAEADAERARAEAAKQRAQVDTTWQKDQAAQAAKAEKEAADQQTLINKVINLRSAYKEFRQEHQTTYQQFQADIDAAIEAMEREGEVTKDQFSKMESAMNRYREASRTGAERQEKDLERETTLRQRAMKLLNQTQHYIDGNSRAYSLFRDKLYGIVQELGKMASGGSGPIDPSQLRAIASELDNIKAAANSAGVSGQTFFEKLQAGWQKFAGWSLVTRSFMLVIRGFKSMINSVKELDSAMTELKKVTDLTAAGYQKFFAQAEQSAMKVGASVSDTINATAD